MKPSKVSVETTSGVVFYDSVSSQLASLFSLTASEVSYQVQDTRTPTSYGSSKVAVLVSSRSKDCLDILSPEDVTA